MAAITGRKGKSAGPLRRIGSRESSKASPIVLAEGRALTGVLKAQVGTDDDEPDDESGADRKARTSWSER